MKNSQNEGEDEERETGRPDKDNQNHCLFM
jgi:hypothetical protein